MKRKARSIIALANAEDLPTEIELVPAGEIEMSDDDSRDSFFNRNPESVVAASVGNQDIPIDFDHGSSPEKDGRSSKAAGWLKGLFVRDGAVWGNVEWSTAGAAALRGKEYRYLSPEFSYDRKTRNIKRLFAAALVNRPAFREMTALASETDVITEIATALGGSDGSRESALATMLDHLRIVHGQAADAGWTEIVEAITERRNAIAEAVGLDGTATASEIATARAARERAMKDFGVSGTAAVDEAVTSGRIPPAARASAERLFERDPEGFTAFAEALPQLLGPSGISGSPPSAKPLGGDEKAIAAACGVSESAMNDSIRAIAAAEAEYKKEQHWQRGAWD
ncbi:MAG: hypothetical protein OXF88_02905 [Rhodobacteraceae bacterium]|nr:hypothetical protein [Paracoccaceae bacterium]